jgi:glycosyltransferase 2 family protein
MDNRLGGLIKLALSLGLGAFIVWFTVHKLDDQQIDTVKQAFLRADYTWVIIGPMIGMLSNVVRALRWQMLLESVGCKADIGNVTHSVFVMYIGNLLFPRLGEVTRCTLIYKTDQVPVDKSIGTMVVERVVDTVTLLLVGLALMMGQYSTLIDFFNKNTASGFYLLLDKWTHGPMLMLLLAGIVVIGGGGMYMFYQLRTHPIIAKIWSFGAGIWQGLISITKLERPWLFVFYSILVWVMYFMMIYVCFRALPETSRLSIWSGMACLFFGAFAFIATQGGVGAYPPVIGALLVVYGVEYSVGFAFGWLVWTLQTTAVIIFGLISFMIISRKFKIAS